MKKILIIAMFCMMTKSEASLGNIPEQVKWITGNELFVIGDVHTLPCSQFINQFSSGTAERKVNSTVILNFYPKYLYNILKKPLYA